MSTPARRLEAFANQLTAAAAAPHPQLAFQPTAASSKSDDDVVIVAALRTAITKARVCVVCVGLVHFYAL